MYGVFLGPVLIALGGAAAPRRAATRRDSSSRWAPPPAWPTSARGAWCPGANDNLSSVAVLVALAHALARAPASGRARDPALHRLGGVVHGGDAGLRAAPLPGLPHTSTEFVCLECVGSPELCVVEGEGMLRMRDYPAGRPRRARPGRLAGRRDAAPRAPDRRGVGRADPAASRLQGLDARAGSTRPSSRRTTTGRPTCPTTSPGSRWRPRWPPASPTCAWRPPATRTEAPAARSAATPCARAGSPPACPPASRRSRKRPRRRSGRRT